MRDENGRKVLRIYSEFESEIGDILVSNNFIAVGRRRKWNMRDLQDGIEDAAKSGWIESAEPDPGWRLTAEGYRELAASDLREPGGI